MRTLRMLVFGVCAVAMLADVLAGYTDLPTYLGSNLEFSGEPALQAYTAGEHLVTWSGLDDRGGRAASGTYRYRLETGGRGLNRTMTMVN